MPTLQQHKAIMPLDELPVEVLEITFVYLDGPALGQVTKTNRLLRQLLQSSTVWKTQVHARFGVVVDAFPAQAPPTWRSIFTNLMWDVSRGSSTLENVQDILSAVERPPMYAMDNATAKAIRLEILLMEGLRRFPHNAALLQRYAGLVRDTTTSMRPLLVF